MFRCTLDTEPKLRVMPLFGLALMANLGLAMARLPLSVGGRFEGDFAKWYPLYRQIPTILRFTARRDQVIAKAERLLPLRYTDPLPTKAPPRVAHSESALA
jgi:hypothetical protein